MSRPWEQGGSYPSRLSENYRYDVHVGWFLERKRNKEKNDNFYGKRLLTLQYIVFWDTFKIGGWHCCFVFTHFIDACFLFKFLGRFSPLLDYCNLYAWFTTSRSLSSLADQAVFLASVCFFCSLVGTQWKEAVLHDILTQHVYVYMYMYIPLWRLQCAKLTMLVQYLH